MATTPTLQPADADQLEQLEQAYALPAVEPDRDATRSAPGRRRRTRAVARAVQAGLSPMELVAAALLVILSVGLVTLFVLALAG